MCGCSGDVGWCVGAVVMWDNGWSDSGCSVDVLVMWGDVWVQ